MRVQERLALLRQKMAERDIEAYIIPTADPHQSEYVSDYYKTRDYMSGFTGSAGTLIVTRKKAGLWTDSRYFLQAEEQLAGSGIDLYKMNLAQKQEDFLKENVSPFGKIGFDGLCMSVSAYRQLSKTMGNRALITDVDYVSEIWEHRPPMPSKKAFYLDERYAGQSIAEKLRVLRFMLRDRECDYTFVSSLDDISYLFNVRGDDVEDTPVILSYALVSEEKAFYFVDQRKISDEVRKALEDNGVTMRDYEAIGDALAEIPGQKVVYLDADSTNITLFRQLKDNVKISYGTNLTSLMKAIKNETEIKNMREAYIKDGVALVRFFNWVETGAQSGGVNERSAVKKLHAFRAEQTDFIEDSFPAIIGYGPNAAIVHYDPAESSHPATIRPEGLLLVDSGGHYFQGTTDITRTYAIGPVSEAESEDYTLVLKSHIAGMMAQFPKGSSGVYVGAIAMQPLFRAKKRFFHGLGHGVGHILSVHEGPQCLSDRAAGCSTVELAPGMVTSVEPGLYIAGSHGIRLESITLVEERGENDFGTWLGFECLTWVPIDTRPVNLDLLSDEELDWLNEYNQTCFRLLSPHLDPEDHQYLAARCQVLVR